MLVTMNNLEAIKNKVSKASIISLDTETTGLHPWKHRLFSIIIATETEEFYFNFNEKSEHTILPREIIPNLLEDFQGAIFLHNAKFDMHFCLNEGLDLTGPRFTIHCTMAIARVDYNDHLSYSLDFLGQKLGHKKLDAVKVYCDKNKLWEWEYPAGKKKRKKRFYDRVPLEIVVPYGEADARICYQLGVHQIASIQDQSKTLIEKFHPRHGLVPLNIMNQERLLTKVLFAMERTGIKLDMPFTMDAHSHASRQFKQAEKDFEALTGLPFKDGQKTLTAAFTKLGIPYPVTEKGNPCFKDEVLSQVSGPIGKILQDYRHAYKKANTYFGNYRDLADYVDIIHPNFKQGGTTTGRMSCSDPNMQNCNKVEEGSTEFHDKYLVRRCFIPREGFTLVMMDYQAQEYRLMADYAGQMDLIEQVISGLDVHQATANMMGVTRRQAKTINFALLYGSGIAKLAFSLFNPSVSEDVLKKIQKAHFEQKHLDKIGTLLGLDYETVKHNVEELEKAKGMRDLYFSKLPKVEGFISQVKAAAINRGWILNWAGRKCFFENTKLAYKAPNVLIQGGSAEIVKRAMVQIHNFLKTKGPFKTRMLLQIHDEVLFEIPKTEYHLIPVLKKTMEDAYPHKHLPMKVEVDYSETSWQDKRPFQIKQ